MNHPTWRLLIVEDDEDDYLLARTMLAETRGRKVDLEWAATYADARKQIEAKAYDAILIDYDLGARTGVDLIREIVAREYPAPAILLTGRGSYEIDVEAMQAGATLYISKNEVNPLLLERFIRYAIERKQSEEALRRARDEAQAMEEALARSQSVLAQAEQIAHLGAWQIDLTNTGQSEVNSLHWSDETYRIFGYQPGEVATSREFFFSQVHPADRALISQAIAQAVAGGRYLSIEYRIRRADGAERTVSERAEVVFDELGQPKHIIGAIQDITERKQAEQNLRAMEVQRRLLEQREMERQQIARDLHDGPVQDLLGMMFPLQTALSLAQDVELRQILASIRGELQKVVTGLREELRDLRPPMLMKFGLSRAIRAYTEELLDKNTCLCITLDLMDDGTSLPENTRLALFRIYQSAINNVMRHAEACEARVKFTLEPGQAVLEIRDNGVGFEIPADWLLLAQEGHLGLVGMRERAEAVDGTLKIQSHPNEGTVVEVTVRT